MNNSVTQFYTKPQAEEGVKFPLLDPDGNETDHWVKVLGEDSSQYRSLLSDFLRDNAKTKDDDDEGQRNFYLKFRAKTLLEWSFEEELTESNIIDVFVNAPDILDQVSKFSKNRSAFLKKK